MVVTASHHTTITEDSTTMKLLEAITIVILAGFALVQSLVNARLLKAINAINKTLALLTEKPR